MKKFSFNSKTLGKLIILPALALIAITIDSCKKDDGIGTANPSPTATANTNSSKSAQLNANISKALRDFVISGAASNQQSGAGAGSNSYSNVSLNVTTYSTPAANVYSWSDPTSGTSFTLSESTGGGGGLGQLAYNGKSFEYNFVLCIKASEKDASWDFLMKGRELRGVVGIDGEITGQDFTLRNLAGFYVAGKSEDDGKYDFITWDETNVTVNDAIGVMLDFSDVKDNSLAGMTDAKLLFTSNGSVEVSGNTFTMSSNAKVKDVVTRTEYPIDGSISCE